LFGLAACAHPSTPLPAAPQVVPAAAPAPRRVRETSTQEVMLQEVKKVLSAAHAEARSCYEAVITPLFHPDVKLLLRLSLRADGTVRHVEVVRMEPDVAGLVACFSGVLADLRFPRDSEDWELEFPMILRSDGMADDVPQGEPVEPPNASP
jgi:hypothetical protein